jgi:transcriptional antiterminator RfaH
MNSLSDSGDWLVASTHPHKEKLAMDNLARQGFRTYCPRIRRRIRHARRLQEVLRPLFPGYVFIRFDPKWGQWRSITSTLGIRSLIRFGELPGTVPDQFVTGLCATEEDGAVSLPPARERYQPGEKVRMREGPFDGLIATVLMANDNDRLVVLMEFLQQSVRVRLGLDEVVPA